MSASIPWAVLRDSIRARDAGRPEPTARQGSRRPRRLRLVEVDAEGRELFSVDLDDINTAEIELTQDEDTDDWLRTPTSLYRATLTPRITLTATVDSYTLRPHPRHRAPGEAT